MDLRYSAEDEAFRTEFRAWLDENLPDDMREGGLWSRAADANEAFTLRREWERKKALAGYAGIQWPKEYGGHGGTRSMKAIYDEEMAKARAPRTVNPLGITFLLPTVMALGTEEQKKEIVPPLLRTDVIWCQGFSEPDAGSDLANLKTKAVREGDEFVVNGQKIWTTNAVHGDMIFAMVRTNPDVAPHKGITMLLIDMHAPGVEARPLKQMSGASEFGEVFFTDVRVPVESRLGDIDDGWRVAMLLLSFERGSSAMGQYTEFTQELQAIIRQAQERQRGGRPAAEDPMVRQRLAHATTELELLRLHSYHILTQGDLGRDLGFEASMTKLQWSEAHQDVWEAWTDVAGLEGQLADPVDGIDQALLQEQFLWTRSETIWGGSSQIQRNIVAERVLGLPR